MNELDKVRAAYAAWNEGDIRPALRHLHPDIDWHTSGTFPGLQGAYRGHEGVLRWQGELTGPFERFVVTILDARVDGDVVTARVRFNAAGAASGAQVEVEFVNEWHFRDGLVVSFRSRPAH